jgi:hypothetical protein
MSPALFMHSGRLIAFFPIRKGMTRGTENPEKPLAEVALKLQR